MATTNEYARLAAVVYAKTPANRVRVGADWEELDLLRDHPLTGFAAGVFRHRGTGEIVIAFTGTNEETVRDWVSGNLPASVGWPSPQVLAAMQLYLRVKQQFGDNISFTGHSLGGGLAGLMAVYFDRPATVFAPAPFEKSALTEETIFYYRASLVSRGLSDPAFTHYIPAEHFAARERNVQAYSIQGEIVLARLGRSFTIVDPARDEIIPVGANAASPVDLHGLLLHAAALESPVFRQALQQVPAMLPVIFDRTLEARNPEVSTEADFLHRLLRRHWGIEGSAAGAALNRFAADALALAGDTGLAQTQARDALLAAAVEYHYYAADAAPFFAVADGHLSFDFGRIVGSGMLSSLGASKAIPRLRQALESAFGADAAEISELARCTLWHIQQGASAMHFTGAAQANDAAVGGVQADYLDGAAGNDVLVGNAGTDVLIGGAGSDVLLGGLHDDWLQGGAGADRLLGGLGFDTYEFAGDFGQDLVLDSDGQGAIRFAGNLLPQGLKLGDNTWMSADRTWAFLFTPSAADATRGTLVIQQAGTGNKITVRDWQRGTLGITLSDTPPPEAPPATARRTILGDRATLDVDPASPGVQFGYDDLGNLLTTEAVEVKADILFDSAEADFIDAGAGADSVRAIRGGDDTIEAGAGPDWVDAGAGRDFVRGGAGWDVLFGGDGDDAVDGGDDEDRVNGMAGDDVLRGGGASDLIGGGAGRDVIYAGAGDDFVAAGSNVQPSPIDPPPGATLAARGQDWGVHVVRATNGRVLTYVFNWSEVDGDADDDIAYGETGNDLLLGGRGSDLLDGGADDDDLVGEEGGDSLIGGAGADRLWGDGSRPFGSGDDWAVAPHETGDDLLDGGEGDDYLVGDGGNDTLLGGRDADTLIGDRIGAGALATPHGSDYLEGGAGNDTLVGGGASDLLYGDAGDDTLLGDWVRVSDDGVAAALDLTQEGDDLLDGGSGNDVLIGGGGSDAVEGGDGRDVLYGDLGGGTAGTGGTLPAGNDLLEGGAGDDTLFGEAGDDTLIGGRGDDYMEGGAGKDTYVYNAGDGNDTIVDTEGENEVVLGAGFDPASARVSVDVSSAREAAIEIAFGGGQSLRLIGGVAGTTGLAFADGTRLSAAELLQRSTNAIDYQAGDANDRIVGTALADRLDGGAGADTIRAQQGDDLLLGQSGDDVLDGGDGDDVLDGGIGRDILIGGAGNDTYRLGLGSGFDEIRDDGGTLQFGAEVRLSDLRVVRSGADLQLVWSNVDRITIRNYEFAPDAWRVRLADGQVVAVGDLPPVSAAPPMANFAQARDEYLRDLRRQWLAWQIAGGLVPNADGTLGGVRSNRWDGVAVTERVSATFNLDAVTSNEGRITAPRTTTSESRTLTFSNVVTTTTYVPVETYVPITIRLPAAPGPRSAPDPTVGAREQTITIGYATTVSYVPRTVRRGREEYAVASVTSVGTLTAGDADNVIEVNGPGIVDAGAGDDVIAPGTYSWGWPFNGALLYGNAGNDRITGTGGDDWLIGGAGDDTLRGGAGADRYIRFAGDGQDVILDEASFGGYSFEGWYHTTEGEIRADLDAGLANEDVLVLPPGVSPADLSLSWSTRTVRADVEEVALRQHGMYVYVNGRLGTSFDVALPVLTLRWGNGEAVDIVFPTRQLPRGYGLEYVEFSDGTRLSRDELFALAPPFDRQTIDADNVLVGVSRGYGGDGNDRLSGTAGDDFLVGGSGDDVLHGDAGNDVLLGGKGADTLDGGDGDDVLGSVERRGSPVYVPRTETGADEYYGTGNTYRGGQGNDHILGTWDADVYEFRPGDGHDLVIHMSRGLPPEAYPNSLAVVGAGFRDYALGDLPPEIRARVESYGQYLGIPLKALDTLRFGPGIAPSDITVRRDRDDLLVAHANGSDSVRFRSWFGVGYDPYVGSSLVPYQPLGRIEFADGTVWSVAADGSVTVESVGSGQPSASDDRLVGNDGADRIDALAGNDRIEAGSGDDVLQGNLGVDVLALGGGADTVILNRGDGADTVVAANAGGGGAGERNDTLLVGGAVVGELRLAREGDDLLVKIAGTGDSLRLAGWYAHADNRTFVALIVDAAPFAAATAPGAANVPVLDFTRIVEGFDRAYAGNPALGDWAIERRYLMPPPAQPLAPIEPLQGPLVAPSTAYDAVLGPSVAADAALAEGGGALREHSTQPERVRVPRLPNRWAGELVQADGTWVKLPAAAGPVAQEGESAPAPMAICGLGEAGARVVGAPYRGTGGVPEQGAPWAAPAVERVFIPRAPRVQPLTAAKVESAIAAAEARMAQADVAPAQAVAALTGGAPTGADLACGRISARWRSIDAWLRAEQGHGTAALLGGEALDATSALPRLDSGAAAWALDEPRRAVRAPRTVMVA